MGSTDPITAAKQFIAATDKLITSAGESAESLEPIKAGIRALAEPTPEQALTAVYRERAHLVALLGALYPSHIGHTDPDAPDWAVVTVETPAGQMSWHIAPRDRDLFGHVQTTPRDARGWDGHTTDGKYERIRKLTAATAMQPRQAGPALLETYTQVTWCVDFADSAGEWRSPAWDLATAGAAEAALTKYRPDHPGQPWRIVKVTSMGRVELAKDSTTTGE